MYPLYKDLRERLGEPLWHDAHGVPRYAPFEPKLLGIYDKWAVLFLVECQACKKQFKCAAGTEPFMDAIRRDPTRKWEDGDFEKLQEPMTVIDSVLGWGDAPWHTATGAEDQFNGQCAGTTMGTGVVAILEVWHRPSYSEWERFELSSSQANTLLCHDQEETQQ